MTVEKTAGQLYDLITAALAADDACHGVRVVAISRVGSTPGEGKWEATFSDLSGHPAGLVAARAATAIKERLQREYRLMDRPA